MIKLLGAILLCCISATSYSQNTIEGTYQLMTTNPKANEVFTTQILTTIENERLEDRIKIIKIGEYTWVRILSVATIESPNFVPLPDETIYVDPEDMIDYSISNNSNN